MNHISVLRLSGMPILDQLRLEESLFRASSRNWCIINRPCNGNGVTDNQIMAADKAEPAAVVLGISGIPQELVHVENALAQGIPLIKRFSGGGTVVVDHNCHVVSFVVNQTALPNVKMFPRNIMQWTELFYRPIFRRPDFLLEENDYCFGTKKFGGNAQALSRGRFCHHTSFLWDFDDARLAHLLTIPRKQPAYRAQRTHSDFLCRLKDHWVHDDDGHPMRHSPEVAASDITALSSSSAISPNVLDSASRLEAAREAFESAVIERLRGFFSVSPATVEEALHGLDPNHLRHTCVIDEAQLRSTATAAVTPAPTAPD